MSLMFAPLRKYATFEGRARRSEYWLFSLFLFLSGIPVGILLMIAGVGVAGAANSDSAAGAGAAGISAILLLLIGVFYLAMFIPSLAVSVRRLHDSDKSGWLMLLCLIPFGSLVILIFTLLDGTPGPNRYGEDPKGRAGPPGSGPVVHNHYYGAEPPKPAASIVE